MPTLDQSYCFCCNEIITWNGAYWQHPDGSKHLHPARPVDELYQLRAQVIDLEKQLAAVRLERDTLRQMLLDEQDRYQELPY